MPLRIFLIFILFFLTIAASGATVQLGEEKPFVIDAPFGPYQPEERAHIVSLRLLRFAESGEPLGLLRIVEAGQQSLEIEASGAVLLTLTERDAQASAQPLDALARRDLEAIRQSVGRYRTAHSARELMKALGMTIGATCLFILVLYALFRGVRALPRSLARAVRIQNAELVSAHSGASVLSGFLLVLWFAVVVVALDFYLPYVLRLYPATRGSAVGFSHWTVLPLAVLGSAFLAYLPDLFAALVIAALSVVLLRLSNWFFQQITAGRIRFPGFYVEWADPTGKLVRFFILALAIVVIGPYLPGAKSPGFQGIGIFLGVLLSLGSTSAVANVVAGVILTYTRAFQTGDRIRIADTTGDVVSRTLLVTQLRTIKNEIVTIPNGTVLGAQIKNYSAGSAEQPLLLHTTVTIGYDVPWPKVHRLLIEAAQRTRNILPDPAPFVLQTALNDFSVSYELNAATALPHNMVNTYGALHEHIQTEFNRAGIEILSPNYISVRDGNRSTIPETET